MDDFVATVIAVLIFVFIGFVVILGLEGFRFSPTNEGIHSGFVTAVQQDGYIFPNYTIYFKTDNSSSQEDNYCVNRSQTALADKLKAFNLSKERVTITFKGVRGIGFGLCKGEEIIGVRADK